MNTTPSGVGGFVSGFLLGIALVGSGTGGIFCLPVQSPLQSNIEQARRFTRAYLAGDYAAFDELIPRNQITHINGVTRESSPDSFRATMRRDYEEYADISATIDEIFAVDDRVFSRGTWRGVKRRDTTEVWEIHSLEMTRYAGGMAVEFWSFTDGLREMLKHGYRLVPPPVNSQ